jgi:carnitine monooxygenase subunit
MNVRTTPETPAPLTWTVPARWYTDPAIAERERLSIFFRSWQWVCHTEALAHPGDYVTPRVLDQNIIVTRGKDGKLHAFHNVCRHRAHELLRGSGRARAIVCPYHGWSYDTEGCLRSARMAEDVAGFHKEDFGLVPVRVEEFCNFVFVNLDANAAPLAEQSGELGAEMRHFAPDLARLTHARRLYFSIASNWKNVVDNFLECYHCPVAHPAFVDLVAMDSYKVTTHGIYSSHMSVGRPGANKAYDIESAEVMDHAVWWLWPNICFLRFPGRGNMMVLNIIPDGVGRTKETLDFYLPDSTPNAAELAAIEYFDRTLQAEDIAIVESVQRGQHSFGFDRGPLMIGRNGGEWSEHGVRHFHGLLESALGD